MPDLLTPPSNAISTIIENAKKDERPTLSFELYPFRDEASANSLWQTLDKILEAGADFVSLTYGAGGTSQERSFAVLERLAPQIPTVGHLTAVGASAASTASIIKRYEDLGVSSILALRGDAPQHDPNALARGEITTALELLEVVSRESSLESGVAAFPEKHPESTSLLQDAEVLAKKQISGAKYAITQLFFSVDSYLEMISLGESCGATLPIIPGLMPISSANQVKRMVEMSGAGVPKNLLASLSDATEEDAKKFGMDFVVNLAAELIRAGAPGLHIFTLNRHESALQIARAVGLAK